MNLLIRHRKFDPHQQAQILDQEKDPKLRKRRAGRGSSPTYRNNNAGQDAKSVFYHSRSLAARGGRARIRHWGANGYWLRPSTKWVQRWDGRKRRWWTLSRNKSISISIEWRDNKSILIEWWDKSFELYPSRSGSFLWCRQFNNRWWICPFSLFEWLKKRPESESRSWSADGSSRRSCSRSADGSSRRSCSWSADGDARKNDEMKTSQMKDFE